MESESRERRHIITRVEWRHSDCAATRSLCDLMTLFVTDLRSSKVGLGDCRRLDSLVASSKEKKRENRAESKPDGIEEIENDSLEK